ncbi:ferrous iron transporter B [Luteimonas sp. BDR2-5]|uniref:FimV/HubP family polar landmark protein n=1 Tax=Proluteimonas luteida TaxID=2878685 RepID=UPI001E5C69FB|nr:FimV/HubP family polar landmark protein [Luteimonas sp. BDR2-5]MCD9028552.1 ferrous iron transporter B [Luteimonas sp. BDR2-5]
MRHRLLRLLSAGALLLAALPAFALGLGRIEVRSQAGQPLLAEIPIVSSDPAELRQLQARLASPETFARIGLDPPQGLVSDLQFNVALDASGRPVIRVTTAAPVQQEALTFLIEVDWGQGRLVREYSALIAVPDTLAAPAQPSIQAPVAAPPPTIVRAPETAETPAPAAAAAPTAVDDTAVAADAEPPPPAPAPAPAEPAPAPVVAPAPAPAAAAPVATAVPSELPPVQAGQNLSALAEPLAEQGGITVNQAMVLLLRANPEAFIRGNLNLIREGAVLRVPPQDQWAQYSRAEATAVVREQVGQWREMRQPAPQPEAPATQEAAAATSPDAASPAAPAVADARLEITPPSGDGQQAGTQSGIDAGGGGDMLRQELQQANETVAARNAEIEELQARLADLERLQQQQQQLIEMKDTELAAAQQRLAESNQRQADAGGGFPWIWLGLGLLVGGVVAWLLARRAASGAARARPVPATPGARPTFAAAKPATPAPAAAAPATASPAWHAGDATAASRPAAHAAPPVANPDTNPDVAGVDTPSSALAPAAATPIVGASVASSLPVSSAEERIELARAYVDLGDSATARELLQEVVDGDDAAASAQAALLLRNLG